MTDLKTAVEAVKEKEAELLALLNDSLAPVMNALAGMNLGIVYVYGYTPGFNDGEPCEHSTDYFIGLEDIAGEERLEGVLDMVGVESEAFELYEGLDYKSSWQGNTEAEVAEYETEKAKLLAAIASDMGIVCGKYDNAAVSSAMNTVVIPALDREFGTDYQVAFVFKDGGFEKFHDEYDCGY